MGWRVHVVGGGVIGLACAWELSRNGHEVTLVAPAPGRDGASWVAAGMLAPVTEAQFGESALTALLVDGATRWPAFAAALEAASDLAIGYDTTGTVTVALDASDRAGLDDLLAYQQSLGLDAHRRSASDCRRLVPALSPALRGGIEVPGDHQVDNRALLGALAEACRLGGVTFVESRVAALEDGPVLVLADGRRLDPECVVLAVGTGLPGIGGLAGAALPPVRPVKGHIVRLGSPAAASPAPLLARTVRGLVHGRSVYLVPRRDGSVVVGATVEEKGSDTAVRAGAVHELLCDARAIVPGIDELELLEASTGLRPATPDNTPRIGWTGIDGVLAAVGHYRNGILLAPLTATAIVDLVGQRPVPPLIEALAPA
jgi:glycine oxidase